METAEQNYEWGFIDKTGKLVIPLVYDWVWDFSEGLAVVVQNGKCGFIDKTGEVVIPFGVYDDVFDFRERACRRQAERQMGVY